MKVEYGIPTDKEALPLALGIERGFFRDEGLDLALKVVFGGPEIAAAYDSGALPIGELGSPPALTALAKGARFKIVGSGIRRRALQYFVAAAADRRTGRRSAASASVRCRAEAAATGSGGWCSRRTGSIPTATSS